MTPEEPVQNILFGLIDFIVGLTDKGRGMLRRPFHAHHLPCVMIFGTDRSVCVVVVIDE